EARFVLARAALEALDLARARELATALVAANEPQAKARAAALLAEVELARGDSTAAAEALDETAERGQGEVVLARAAVGLARRAPAEAVAGELAAWLKRAREPALVLRGHELLG